LTIEKSPVSFIRKQESLSSGAHRKNSFNWIPSIIIVSEFIGSAMAEHLLSSISTPVTVTELTPSFSISAEYGLNSSQNVTSGVKRSIKRSPVSSPGYYPMPPPVYPLYPSLAPVQPLYQPSNPNWDARSDVGGESAPKKGRMWGLNATGQDFHINQAMRPDIITSVTHLPEEAKCAICAHTPDLLVPLEEIGKRRDMRAAIEFLEIRAPDLAARSIVQRHFDHMCSTMEDMCDNLLKLNYDIAVTIGREFAMVVTANKTQLTIPNDRNLKGLAQSVSNFDKLVKTKLSLQNAS
jgi:hypothetical protein